MQIKPEMQKSLPELMEMDVNIAIAFCRDNFCEQEAADRESF